jgi:imidazolonepropionase-like amidohydrolase
MRISFVARVLGLLVLVSQFELVEVVSDCAAQTSSSQPQGLRNNDVKTWALTNARVVLEPGKILDSATIVVDGTKIVAVGTSAKIPSHARVINLSGKTIYPGLIDGFTEQAAQGDVFKNGSEYWHEWIRPQLQIVDQLQNDNALNSTLRGQGITARLVAPTGGIMKGSGSVVLTNAARSRHSIVKRNVTQHVRLTVQRGPSRTYPNSPMGAVALARQAIYDAVWHQQAKRASSANASLESPEHNDALDALNVARSSKQPFVIDSSNELFFLRADLFAKEFGLNLIVRGSGNEYRRLEAIRETGRAVLVPVDFPQPPNVETVAAARGTSLESLMHWDHAPENPGAIERAGITFALCSHGLNDKATFLRQVRKAVKRGLSKDAALKALTTTPAKLFGVDAQIGSIAVGKIANLVVTDGDLFEDKTKVVSTWVAGQQSEFETKPTRKLAGRWILRLGKQSPVKKVELTLTGETSLKGELSIEGKDAKKKTIKLDKVVLNGARLSASFHTKTLDLVGVARFTIVFESDSEPVGIGSVAWADGTKSNLTATKIVTEKVQANEKSSAEKKTLDDQSKTQDEHKASFAVNFPLGAFGRSAAPSPPAVVVFRNATVWTNGKLGILKNANVVVRDGVITAVGGKIKAPKDAIIVDAKGMHLSPGIIDCHSHMATDGGVNESGQAVTAEVRIGDFIDSDDMNIYRQLAGGVTSSNILHGSANPIGGQNQVIKLRWGALPETMKFAQAPQGIKFALGENVKQSNWGEEYTTRYPQTRMGVEQAFRDEFHAAIEYTKDWDKWNKSLKLANKKSAKPTRLPPRRDLELDAIAEIVNHKRWIHCHSYRQDEILSLIRVLDDFKIRIGTFQHILEGYKVADAMAKHGAMGSAFSDWWAYKFEVYDAIPYAGALMHNAGVVVSFNSDDRELARHLNHEAAKAVKYGGVPPEEAFKFVTLNTAKQLRIDKHVGSIEVGKHADIVLWSGSPLSNFSRCEQTWIDGRKYFDRAEDQELRKLTAKMRNHLIQKILDSGEAMRAVDAPDKDPATLWPRHDAFCHGHDHGDEHQDHIHDHSDEKK